MTCVVCVLCTVQAYTLSVVSVVCCQVEVSVTSLSLVQRSRTDCGASLCVLEKPHLRGAKHQSIVIELTRSPRWRGPHYIREFTS